VKKLAVTNPQDCEKYYRSINKPFGINVSDLPLADNLIQE